MRKKQRPHELPEVLELFDAIAKLAPMARSFDGTIVRSVSIRYSNAKEFMS